MACAQTDSMRPLGDATPVRLSDRGSTQARRDRIGLTVGFAYVYFLQAKEKRVKNRF